MLGLAAAVTTSGRNARRARQAPVRGVARVRGSGAAGLAALSFALPWLAEREVEPRDGHVALGP